MLPSVLAQSMTDTGVVAVGGTVVAVVAGVGLVACVEGAMVDCVAPDAGAVAAVGGAHVLAAGASAWSGAGARLQAPRPAMANAAMIEAARNEGRRFMGTWLERRCDRLGLAGAGRDQRNVTPWKGQAETSRTPIRQCA